MNNDYLQKHEEMQKSRKKVKDDYAKAVQYQAKMIQDYESLEKSLDENLVEYQKLTKKKESSATLLKVEMKVRLLKQEIDAMKAKLTESKTKLDEETTKVLMENQKIKQFTQHWKKQRHSVFQNTLRSIISILEEHYADIDRTYENLLTLSNKKVDYKKGKC